MSAEKNIEIKDANCSKVRELMYDFVDSTSTPANRHLVEKHLVACVDCTLELEQIRTVESALAGSRSTIPSPGSLYSGFAQKLEASQKRRLPIWQPSNYGLAFAAITVVAVVLSVKIRNNAVDQRNAQLWNSLSPGEHAVANLDSESKDVPSAYPKSNFGYDASNPGANSLNSKRVAITNKGSVAAPHGESARNWAVLRSAVPHNSDVALNSNETGNSANMASVRKPVLSLTMFKADGAPTGVYRRSVSIALSKSYSTVLYKTVSLADIASGSSSNSYYSNSSQLLKIRDHNSLSFSTADSLSVKDVASFTAARPSSLSANGLLALGASSQFGVSADSVDAVSNVKFALVVEDDVRGFTSEAHDTLSDNRLEGAKSAASASAQNSGIGGGAKVEVEFDDDSNVKSF